MMQESQNEQHEGTSAGHEGAHEGHEGQAHGGAHEAHEHAPADINWANFGVPKQTPYLANVINFAILIWVFVRFGKAPIAKALQERRERIKREIDDAQRIQKEAQARAKKYQKKLANIDSDKKEIEKEILEAGATEKQRIVREAEEKAARMERDAKALLESEIAGIRQELVHETVNLSVEAAEELLRARITAADHERLAEDFLQDLAARNAKNKAVAAPPAGPRGSGGTGGGPSSRPPFPRPPTIPPRVPAPRAETSEAPIGGGSE